MNSCHHPNDFLLKQFASGEVNDQLAVLIASHLETCQACQEQLHTFEKSLSERLFNPSASVSSIDFSDMAEAILGQPREKPTERDHKSDSRRLSYDGLEFNLPQAMIKLKKLMGPWKKKLNKFYYSKVNLSGPGQFYFIYFKPGVKIPLHTHQGNEYVYVVAGSFEDGVNEYHTGTFANFDHTHSHAPQTNDPDGCLLVTSIEAPFYFQKGWSRLFNIFGKLLYR